MNLRDLIGKSAIGQKLLQEDLKDRAKDRKVIVDQIATLKKQLSELSTKPIASVEAEIKKVEAQLAQLRDKRSKLIIDDQHARNEINRQIKQAEAELSRNAPIVVASAMSSIHERLRAKSSLLHEEGVLVKSLLSELEGLVFCLDDEKVMRAVQDIESRAASVL